MNGPKHGTRSRYDKGCRCDPCREAKRLYSALYAAGVRRPNVTTRTLGEADVSWMGAAACANKGPQSWFSEVHPVEALRVCSECPVRDACLDYALSTNQEHGIWGGLTQEERKNVRRSRRRSA